MFIICEWCAIVKGEEQRKNRGEEPSPSLHRTVPFPAYLLFTKNYDIMNATNRCLKGEENEL